MNFQKEYEREIRLLRLKMLACQMPLEFLAERLGISVEHLSQIFSYDCVPTIITYFEMQNEIDTFFNIKLMENENKDAI